MSDNYIVCSDKFDELYDFIYAHSNQNYTDKLYEKYSNSPFARFSWILEADSTNEQLVIFNYLLAKWLDRQISSSEKNILEKLKMIMNDSNSDFMKISYQYIDNDFIEKMFLLKDDLSDLEDNLINLIGQKI